MARLQRLPSHRPDKPTWDSDRSYLTGAFLIEPPQLTPPNLSSYPEPVQHKLAIQDALNALLGLRPNYASIASIPSPTFAVSHPHLQSTHPDIASLLTRILPLATHHAAVKQFIEHTRVPHSSSGHVRQALGVALEDLLSDYNSFILRLEAAALSDDLSLQKLLYYVQPTSRSMALLCSVASSCSQSHGAAALNDLYTLAVSFVGSDDSKQVLAFLLGRAAQPILDVMATWIGTGVIDDPYNEFFIIHDPSYSGPVADDKSWEMRYTINWNMVPDFLKAFVEDILRAGKYLSVLRECGVDLQQSLSEAQTKLNASVEASNDNDTSSELRLDCFKLSGNLLLGSDASRRISKVVDRAFRLSSTALMSYLEISVRLRERLRSLRRFFLMQQGDFLVHFLDSARNELAKGIGSVSRSKLASLLDLSIRTSVSSTDPFQDDLSCELSNSDLASQIAQLLVHNEDDNTGTPGPMGMKSEISGYESFSLTYRLSWPLNLIVSEMDIIKYQFIFRYLFYCKHVERELEVCWSYHSQAKGPLRLMPNSFVRSFALRNRMMQFIRNMLYYTVVDVLEPNWRTLEEEMRKAKTIDDIMVHHANFLLLSSTQSLLSNEKHLQVFKNIAETCISFSAYTARFSDLFASREAVAVVEQKLRQRKYPTTLAKFETSFDMHIDKLLDGLSAFSKKRANVHVANLCEKLDVGGYYTRHKERSLASFGNIEI